MILSEIWLINLNIIQTSNLNLNQYATGILFN